MSLQRAPWWMYVVGASFLAYFAMVDYTFWSGPEPVGIDIEYGQHDAVLSEIEPGSPAERAGLQLGDHLVTVNGLAVHHDLDWYVVGTNFESNRPQRFEIERAGLRLDVEVTLGPRNRAWAHMDYENRFLLIWYPLVQIVLFGLSLFISFSRPYDLVARVGGSLLAATGVVFALANPPYGVAVTSRHLPVLVGALLWIPYFAGTATFVLLFTFCAIFPRRLLRTLWIWIAWSVFALVSAPSAIHVHYEIRQPSRAIGLLPSWYLSVISCASPKLWYCSSDRNSSM